MKNKVSVTWVLIICTISIFMSSCCNPEKSPKLPTTTFNINIVDPKIDETINIDFLGLNEALVPDFNKLKWNEYLAKRNDNKHLCYTISYTNKVFDKPFIDSKDPIWNVWKSSYVQYILIFTDYSKVANRIPRVIPLHKNCWETGFLHLGSINNINISLNKDGYVTVDPTCCECCNCAYCQ